MTVTSFETYEEFEEILKKLTEKPLFVFFSGIGCGPCENVAPHYEKFSEDYEFDFYKTKRPMTKERDDVFMKQLPHIQAFPTFIFFRYGIEFGRVLGDSSEQLKEWIELSIKYKDD